MIIMVDYIFICVVYSIILLAQIQRYLTKHAYANAETDDLWNAMTEVSFERCF